MNEKLKKSNSKKENLKVALIQAFGSENYEKIIKFDDKMELCAFIITLMDKSKLTSKKSAFEELKESITDSIKGCKTLTELKESMEIILREYDLEEER